MQKEGRPHPESKDHVICPFCGESNARTARWCSGCGAGLSKGPDGVVEFDSDNTADRQTLEQERAETGRGSRGTRRRPVRLGKKRR